MEAITFDQADHTNRDSHSNDVPCTISNGEIITKWQDDSGNILWLRIKAVDVEYMQIQTENPL